MKKVLVVLVVAVAMLLVGCPQPAGDSIPDEMTVTSVSLVTLENGEPIETFFIEAEIEGIIFMSTGKRVEATQDGEKYIINPSVVIKRATLAEILKELDEIAETQQNVKEETTYSFADGHLTVTVNTTVSQI